MLANPSWCPFVPSCLVLGKHLLVNDNVLVCLSCACSTSDREPLDWVLVEERPRRNNGDEGQSCAGQTYLERECDILCEETDEEGDDLNHISRAVLETAFRQRLTPTAASNTVARSSASFCPSKSYHVAVSRQSLRDAHSGILRSVRRPRLAPDPGVARPSYRIMRDRCE